MHIAHLYGKCSSTFPWLFLFGKTGSGNWATAHTFIQMHIQKQPTFLFFFCKSLMYKILPHLICRTFKLVSVFEFEPPKSQIICVCDLCDIRIKMAIVKSPLRFFWIKSTVKLNPFVFDWKTMFLNLNRQQVSKLKAEAKWHLLPYIDTSQFTVIYNLHNDSFEREKDSKRKKY